jgi:LAO/AO transport system kinase
MAEQGPKQSGRRRELTVEEFFEGVRAGDRAVLGRALTLIESQHPQHRESAQELLTRLMPHTGGAYRVGITGVPGVGKSSFIESFGSMLTGEEHRVAVLAVDPSSSRSGGSILADKTRMARLGADPRAFIRPSPSAGTLGGVARKTREALLVCEAAGFDVVLVETVGVGQSETVVADMTDFFLVLMLAGAGDELQGIKKGILELATMLVINKADGENETPAHRAAREYQAALHYMRPSEPGWETPVLTCSAREGTGLDMVWKTMDEYREQVSASGRFESRRREQMLGWMWAMVDDHLRQLVQNHPGVKKIYRDLEADVREGRVPPTVGAARLLLTFLEE